MEYKGWDCHGYTEDFKQLWLHLQSIKKSGTDENKFGDLKTSMSSEELNLLSDSIAEFLRRYLPQGTELPWQAMQKMKSRFQEARGGYEDGSLVGLNVLRLLEAVWKRVSELNDESINTLFIETLDDIQLTCPEGDSHRLMMLFVSLVDV